MIEAQMQLQNALNLTYHANLLFLIGNDKLLYERIQNLSNAIYKKEYKERFLLEFIEDSGDFDIFDSNNNKYLYNKRSKEYNNKALANTNFDKKGIFSYFDQGLFTGETIDNLPPKNTLQEASLSSLYLYNDLYEYIQILEDDTKGNKEFKEIEKFIFIGTLLGRHIPSIVDKIKAKKYFVCENNLEIFRLSLFVVDYTILIKNASLQFSIMEDDYIFSTKMNNFLTFNSYHNHTIKYFTTDYNVVNSFNLIINTISSTKPTIFNYNMILHNVVRNTTSRINKFKFLEFEELQNNFSIFNGLPLLVVGAGPSLDDNVSWLKENQDRFIIVAMGASFQKLMNNNIIPSMIFTLDSSYEMLNMKQFSEESCKRIEDIIIIASGMTAQKILDRFNKNKLFIYEVLTNFKKSNISIDGFSIGEITLKLLSFMNFKEIYLLGTDLAINQETGDSHIKENSSVTKKHDIYIANERSAMDKGIFDTVNDLIKVKGNFESDVWTTRTFFSSLSIYNKITKFKKDEQIIYNLSNHGVYIENTISLKTKDVKINYYDKINKKEILERVLIELNKNSSFLIREEEIVIINEKLFIQELIKFLKKSFSTVSSYKDFEKEFILIQKEINKSELNVLNRIIPSYYTLVNTYIDYHFNDIEIKNEKEKIKKIADIWKKKINEILKDYLDYLNKI